MFERKPVEDTLAFGGETDQHLTAIFRARFAYDRATLFGAIDQLDGAVVAELKAIGKFADGGKFSCGEPFDGEKELVLLRFDSDGPGGVFAIAKEPADLVAEFGQIAIGGERKIA